MTEFSLPDWQSFLDGTSWTVYYGKHMSVESVESDERMNSTESMNNDTISCLIEFIKNNGITRLNISGISLNGRPHPNFLCFFEQLAQLGTSCPVRFLEVHPDQINTEPFAHALANLAIATRLTQIKLIHHDAIIFSRMGDEPALYGWREFNDSFKTTAATTNAPIPVRA